MIHLRVSRAVSYTIDFPDPEGDQDNACSRVAGDVGRGAETESEHIDTTIGASGDAGENEVLDSGDRQRQ